MLLLKRLHVREKETLPLKLQKEVQLQGEESALPVVRKAAPREKLLREKAAAKRKGGAKRKAPKRKGGAKRKAPKRKGGAKRKAPKRKGGAKKRKR